jgi:glycosyltransferase involved in cell wall biosynthesis
MPAAPPPLVLLPARDEAARIGPVIDALRVALPGAQVWVIDGGSADGTAAAAAARGATVLAQRGRGYASAVHEGVVAAWRAQAPAALLLDADGQHPPAAAPALLAALDQADWAVASRAGTASPGPLRRRLGNRALQGVVFGLTGRRFGDLTSGMQALGPAALRLFAQRAEDGVADANLRVLAARAGLRVAELPVQMAPRGGGRSMHDGLAGLQNLGRTLAACAAAARAPLPA